MSPTSRTHPVLVLAAIIWSAVGPGFCADQAEIQADIEALSSFGSRVAGYPGAEKAEDYVRTRLAEIGFPELLEQELALVSPVDKGFKLTLDNGDEIRLHAVWPNLVATGTALPGDVAGPLVYGGDGEFADFGGLPMDGAIVLMDFNCGTRWLNAAMLGAQAVIFVQPDETTRQDALEKYSRVPIEFPRYYLAGEDADTLVSRAIDAKPGSMTCEITGRMDWEEVTVRTLIAEIPGTDAELRQEAIVLQAYYDSMSVVPALAPGAEQACGIAAFLQIAEHYVDNPPARSVILVASPGHFMGLSGMRHLADIFGPKGRRPGEQEDFYHRGVNDLQKLIDRLDEAMADTRERAERLSALAASERDEDEQRYELQLTPRGEIHWEAELARMAAQRERMLQDLELMGIFRAQERIPLTVSLDLTSRSRQFGLTFAGHYFDDSTVIRFLSPLGKKFSNIAEEIAAEDGWDFERLWFDGTNPKQDRNWWDYFPGRIAFESEMILRAGRPAVTFATGNDGRLLFDTPMDQARYVDYESVAFQAASIEKALRRFLDDPTLDQTAFKRTKRLKLPYNMYPLIGRTLEFVRRASFLPQTPVPGALVVVRGASKTLMGVRTDAYAFADGDGDFRIIGHQNGANVDAYYLDPESGRIRYAPDLGSEGERKFTRAIWQRGRQDRPLIIFPCESIALYDLVDQRYLETLEQVFVYNAKTDAEPHSFGYELPVFNPPAGETGLAVEPCAVLFAEKDIPIKATLGMGLLGARMLLLNSSEEQPTGTGFMPGEQDRIPFTVFQAARDMHLLDEKRINDFVTKGVKNPQVESLHAEAGARLDEVPKHLENREYDEAVALARAAWAYESSAYPDVQKTSRDVVYGVVFYLALLLSFTYFAERLAVAATTVAGRVAWSVGIFLAAFIMLRYFHPAFDLAVNPFIILLAFVVLALALLVISIVVGKFNEQLEQLKQELGGIHKADVGRMSAAAMAFSLGVANMRRRGVRTALTCTTLVLVTFTVLSFTSVRTGVKINKLPRDVEPAYTGFFMRDKVWVQLEDTIPDVMRNEWGDRYVVAPRAWHISGDITKRANYEVRSYANPASSYTVHAILGLSPQETLISGLHEYLIEGGRWFSDDESQAVILPASIAEELGVTPEAVARWNAESAAIAHLEPIEPTVTAHGQSVIPEPDLPTASGERVAEASPHVPAAAAAPEESGARAKTEDAVIRSRAEAFGEDAPVLDLNGSVYAVVGIIPDGALDPRSTEGEAARIEGFQDLDGEAITPVDFSQLKPEVLNQVREMMSQRYKLGRTGVSSLLQDYEHYVAGQTLIMPYGQTLRIGGTTRSVAMGVPSVEETQEIVDEYMERLAVSLYATGVDEDTGEPGVFLYSSIGSRSLQDVETVLIPLLIAALIVLNTMLGAVWERVREIHIFSSVGLSPTHVGALFFAESCVYANLGAILGYLLGQGITKVLFLTNSLGAVETNYSSLSAVFATVVVLATVLLSTIWPARKAAQIAVPDIERRWKLPEPEGDVMTISMPFTVTGRDAPACNAFLEEFFQA
ncbi:MAG: FtsX-like permease family protein, partial [Armatimonadia bacterium]|nr:FtsX-like permease family protein [Armatimonadia bacterium]